MARYVVLIAMLFVLSTCNLTIPYPPQPEWCWPGNSWQCDPRVEWSDM